VYEDATVNLTDVEYVEARQAFAVVGSAGVFLYSSNNGATWINRRVNTTKTLHAIGDGFGLIYVSGDSGFTARTFDGTSWVILPATTTARLTCCAVPRFDNVIVAGDGGTLRHSTNYGANWTPRSLGTTANFNTVFYAGIAGSGGKGWAAGDSGRMFRTTDNGTTWQPLATGTTRSIRDMVFLEPAGFSQSSALNDTGAIVGEGGLVRYTTNGGTTWLSDRGLDTLTTRSINFITIVDSHTVAVGGDGIVMYTSDLTLTGVGSQPTTSSYAYSLLQNYPNPFNPTTHIRFRVQRTGSASLVVYDLLGREIATLVNEPLEAGEHERTLDAKGLPSGIYFYRLRIGEFTDVKKMVLAK
jgi:photosystem II stability/assembly factor-like uncharacterized protein